MDNASQPRQASSLGRRLVTFVVAGALAAGTSVYTQIVDSPHAHAATTALISEADFESLAERVAEDQFPSGSALVIVAEEDDDAVLLASSIARHSNAPTLVTDDGSSAASLLGALDDLNATDVILVATNPAWFTTGFVSDLTGASIAVQDRFDGSDRFTRWSEGLPSSQPPVIVMSEATSDVHVNLATALSSGIGAPLVLWDSSSSSTDLETFFSAYESSDLIFVTPTADLPYQYMSDVQIETSYHVGAEDPGQAFAWIAAQSQARGVDSNKLYVAPSDSRGSLGIAALAAAHGGALAAPAGAATALDVNSRADEYLSLWKSETLSVTLVGLNLDSNDLADVAAPTLTSHASAPSFRVLDVSLSGSNYTYTFSTVAGATEYNMFDTSANLLGTSSGPSIALGAQVNKALVTAEDSSGELARFELRLNDYTSAGDRRTAMLGSTDGGTNHLAFLADVEVPRLVSRTTADPFSMDPSPSAPVVVAITCEWTFTETGLDATKQYAYIVEEMTNVDSHACDSANAVAAAIDEERMASQVTFPPTSFPWLRGGGEGLGPHPTIAESLLTEAIENAASVGESLVDPSPLFFRWIAYIPEEYIPYPAITGDLAKPVPMFGGDDVSVSDPNISARFTQTIYMFFGQYNHGIVYNETMGETHQYKCSGIGIGCSLIDSATAPLTDLWQGSTTSTATTGRSGGIASASNPLLPGLAPPIDVIWQAAAQPSRIILTGYHDNMPKHEMWFGIYPGHAYLGYSSTYLSAAQLPCLFSVPGAPISYCSVYFNMQL